MQTLFHRVAQVRASCRCPQCLHTTHGLSRRATASATRRMPRYAVSSTFWYSATFALAASFDAVNKAHRSEKWERAIEDVKKELGQPLASDQEHRQREAEGLYEAQQIDRLPDEHEHQYREQASISLEVDDKSGLTIAPRDAAVAPSAEWSAVDIFAGDEAIRELERNVDSSTLRTSRPMWPVSTQPDQKQHHVPPQSIYASDWYKEKFDAIRYPAAKLQRVSIATDMMLTQFMKKVHLLNRSMNDPEQFSLVPPHFASTLLNLCQKRDTLHVMRHSYQADLDLLREHLKDGDFHSTVVRSEPPLTHFVEDDAGDFRIVAYQRNQSLQQLFKDCETGALSLSAMLTRVVYNIMTSTAPPDLDTFNTLIVGWTKLRRLFRGKSDERDVALHDLTQASIRGHFNACMRPNEVTIASLLEWYTMEGKVGAFKKYVERMRGQHNGLMFAREEIRITGAGASRLIVPEDDGKDWKFKRIIQLPYPTPMVFGALVKGVLKFSGFDAALDVCQGMAHEGWGLSMSGLNPLLLDCVERRDWNSGLAVWNQIRVLKLKARMRRGREEPVPLPVFATMLRLCTRCARRHDFEDVMEQATEAYPCSMPDLVRLAKNEKAAQPKSEYPYLTPPRRPVAPGSSLQEDVQEDQSDLTSGMPPDTPRQDDESDASRDDSTDLLKINTENEDASDGFGSISWADIEGSESERGSIMKTSTSSIKVKTPEHRTVHQREPGHGIFRPFTLEELHGHLPASEHLEEYERRERPMNLHE